MIISQTEGKIDGFQYMDPQIGIEVKVQGVRNQEFPFNRYMQAVKTACILNEDLCQDIYEHESKRNYKDVQIWQEQANELARFVLLLADISPYMDYVNEVFKHLRSFKGEGIITEEVLKNFYLKKL